MCFSTKLEKSESEYCPGCLCIILYRGQEKNVKATLQCMIIK